MKINSLIIGIVCMLCCTSINAQNKKTFLDSPEVILNPDNYYKYAADSRRFTGIPSLAVTPDGRMWATWYAGRTPGEDANNYVVLATSDNGGESWEEVLVVDPDEKGPVRTFDPELWIAPDHTLWLFWAQSTKENYSVAGVWALKTCDMENRNAIWESPVRLSDGIMMCKPTLLSDGTWLLPASTWRETDNSAKVVVSTDSGKTWALQGGCNVPKKDREFDEHIVVERKDGTLWMLVRTKYGIAETFSRDTGKTWSELQPSSILHTSSRFFIRRLNSGNLLLIKHGPVGLKTGRSHLMAFISKDDGSSWSKGLLLDERPNISYPDGQQAADGMIHIVYDFDRTGDKCILYTCFKEEDVLSGEYDRKTVEVFNRRRVVSKGGR